MEPEKSASLWSQIAQWLRSLQRTLFASFASAWAWFSARISSGRAKLVTHYKAIGQRTETPKNKEEQRQEGQNNKSTDLSLQPANHRGREEERQHGGNENGHSNRQEKSAFILRLLRWLWRRRRSYISVQSIEIILAAAIAIAAWTQAKIYWEQSIIMREALRQNETSIIVATGQLNAANETLKSSQRIFQIDQRPYVVVAENGPEFVDIPPSTQKPVMVNVHLKNIGKTPAIQVITQAHFFAQRQAKLIYELSPQERMEASRKWVFLLNSKFNEMHRIATEIRRQLKAFEKYSIGQDLPPTQQLLLTPGESFNMKDSDIPDLFSQHMQFVVIGYASYIDTQGTPYDTEYCYQFVGNFPTIWHICDTHNHIR